MTAAVRRIELGYSPRQQFIDFHKRRARWACMVCHRRAGKTVACVNDLVDAAIRCKEKEPRFAYVAPTYSQAKDIAWSYLKAATGPIQDIVQRESDLSVIFPHNKARVRLYGAENYDRQRGIYLDGLVMDEIGDIDPRAWPEVYRAALSDRGGWAVFIGTSKGRNAFYKLYQDAVDDPDEWFSLMLKASETGIVPEHELRSARNMLTPEQYAQEYECSFDAAVIGSYFGRELTKADEDGRITKVPHDRTADVVTAWDLGINDPTIIWFAQIVGREIHIIDYYESSDQGLDHFVKVVKDKPYVYADHLLPHDGAARELGTGKSRQEMLDTLGLRVSIVQRHNPEDGINAVRMALSRCWFDADKCGRGLEALRFYQAERNAKHEIFSAKPVHNWASHPADAFRCLIMGMDDRPNRTAWPKGNTEWVV